MPFGAAAIVFWFAFFAFQVIGGLGVAAGVAADMARGAVLDLQDTAALVGRYPHLVLGGNALGQALGFGLVAWGATRLSTRRVGAFLRLRRPDAAGLGLSALGWVAIYPLVIWLGELNAKVPVPQWLQGLDQMRGDMLESLLFGGGVSPVFLFLTIALTPAIFEEVLFRGYLFRQTERQFGAPIAIVLVGVGFGAYHLSPATLVPLSVLGVYLCFVVWVTGSLWSGVLVHLLNNGFAVVAAAVAMQTPGFDPETVGEVGGPWYVAAALALAGAVGVLAVCRLMLARREAATGGRPDAAPVLVSDSLPSAAAPAAVLS